MTIYNLNGRVNLLDLKVQDLYKYVKVNSVGGDKDIEITDSSKGLILTSPNGSKFRISINDSGVLQINSLQD